MPRLKISFGAWFAFTALSAAAFLLCVGAEGAARTAFLTLGMALNALSMFSEIRH